MEGPGDNLVLFGIGVALALTLIRLMDKFVFERARPKHKGGHWWKKKPSSRHIPTIQSQRITLGSDIGSTTIWALREEANGTHTIVPWWAHTSRSSGTTRGRTIAAKLSSLFAKPSKDKK